MNATSNSFFGGLSSDYPILSSLMYFVVVVLFLRCTRILRFGRYHPGREHHYNNIYAMEWSCCEMKSYGRVVPGCKYYVDVFGTTIFEKDAF